MPRLNQTALRSIIVAHPHFALVRCRGELIDGHGIQREAQRLGIALPVVELAPLDAARVLYGTHPLRAVRLLRDTLGVPTLEALQAIGVKHQADELRRISHAERMESGKLPKRTPQPSERLEGNPIA